MSSSYLLDQHISELGTVILVNGRKEGTKASPEEPGCFDPGKEQSLAARIVVIKPPASAVVSRREITTKILFLVQDTHFMRNAMA